MLWKRRGVFAKDNILNPMQAIFNIAMAANCEGKCKGICT
jgi:hypothetical protein